MLQKGDLVPHFEVETVHGQVFRYSAIWQQKNLVLVMLPRLESTSVTTYVSQLTAQIARFSDAECVITHDSVPGLAAPAVVVADRWGEIVYAGTKAHISDLPPPEELLDWVGYVQSQCPECQGEAR